MLIRSYLRLTERGGGQIGAADGTGGFDFRPFIEASLVKDVLVWALELVNGLADIEVHEADRTLSPWPHDVCSLGRFWLEVQLEAALPRPAAADVANEQNAEDWGKGDNGHDDNEAKLEVRFKH